MKDVMDIIETKFINYDEWLCNYDFAKKKCSPWPGVKLNRILLLDWKIFLFFLDLTEFLLFWIFYSFDCSCVSEWLTYLTVDRCARVREPHWTNEYIQQSSLIDENYCSYGKFALGYWTWLGLISIQQNSSQPLSRFQKLTVLYVDGKQKRS